MDRRNGVMVFIWVALVAVVLSASSIRGEESGYKPKTSEIKKIIDSFTVDTPNWKYRSKCDEKCFQKEVPEGLKWKAAGPGMYWPEAFQTFWFRKIYTVPDKVEGRSVKGSIITMYMNVSDHGEVYVNGVKVGEENGSVITDSAEPGEKIVIGVKVTNGTWPGAYLGTTLKFSVFDEIEKKTKTLLETVNAAANFVQYEKDKDKWTNILNKSVGKIDIDALKNGNDGEYFASLDAANGSMLALSPLFKQYTVYLDGYSHIDLAWLWDKEEGEMVTRNTLDTVFKLLNEYPEWIYTHSQAHGVKWMEDDYPEIFSKLKEDVEKGRIELVGGTWSENDSNLPGGEGLVRQFLYGKRYFREKFGKDIVVGWTPDSFGYNWNLPQILVKSGMIGFLTQKLGSNEVNRFPYGVFWWEGADGSKVLTYFPPSGYASDVKRADVFGFLSFFKSEHHLNENYTIFGVGDHGGGVTREQLNRIFELKKDPLFANVEFTSAEKYYKHLNDLAKTSDFPTWDDELYLEHHRGTYTTQANNKKNNRRTEQLLQDSEKVASLAGFETKMAYPQKKLFDQGWYYVLFSHMHDILPGSGIRKVYEDSDKDYAIVYKATGEVIDESLSEIGSKIDTDKAGEPLMVFNTLSWKRDALVEYEYQGITDKVEVTDSNGVQTPAQKVEKGGKSYLLFEAREMPAGGYKVYQVFPNGGSKSKASTASDVKIGDYFMENKYVKVTFDPASGDLSGVFDKKLGRELLTAGKQSNLLQAFKDTQNAWEIQTNDPIVVTDGSKLEVVERGPVRWTFKVIKKVGESTFEKYVSLCENDPLVYGRLDVSWHERNTTTKLAFNLNLLNEDAWFEIPYAAISRKAIPKTKMEMAKFEVSAHNWVDYTDKDGSCGVSLLNNSKYGFDVKDNVMRMTLLRSPIHPDTEADQGNHSIEYALYTHAGDWREADTSRRGNEFNYKAQVVKLDKHKGALSAEKSYFSAAPDDVNLTVIKRAEDGNAYVIRIVETEGQPTEAKIKLPMEPKSVVETNLIEDEMKDGAAVKKDGDTINVKLGKYEIKSLKITF